MIARLGISISSGVIVTFALLWLMQFLIATGREALSDKVDFRMMDFIRVKTEELVEQKDRKPPKPPEVKDKPPEMPPPDMDAMDPNAPKVNLQRVSVDINMQMGGTDFAVDGEYLPIVRVEPMYPRRAQTRGIEGYCDMEFTVLKTGEVTNAVATECSSSVFKNSSVKAVLKWKYKPRVVNGEPIDSPGVRTRLTYKFEE
ncbi:MAG TPA: TonB family protein [Gammaproteobacteria bacterium]|jgi:protein TonB|nr:protein TonB [Chromatiales bacterium]MCP4926067.1 TonB family protein [Gammaproteobacteria bacterium]HJP39913.1 TonB family protein [Gammaproteobacteria bacterium]